MDGETNRLLEHVPLGLRSFWAASKHRLWAAASQPVQLNELQLLPVHSLSALIKPPDWLW